MNQDVLSLQNNNDLIYGSFSLMMFFLSLSHSISFMIYVN